MNTFALPLLLLLAQDAKPAAPPASEAPKVAASGPVVVLDTSLGKIKLRLFKDKAPISVDNFVKYVRAGHYDGTIFHRVIPGFMAQGGGFEPGMKQRTQTLRPPIKNEAANGLKNVRGTLAMARTAIPDSATAQFFVNVKDNGFLDYQAGKGPAGAGYAVFGEVVEGMDVVDKIVAVPRNASDVPNTAIVIKTAREQ
jgi:cyclophilin family peptidyl-prolyl cis-trans isomerase